MKITFSLLTLLFICRLTNAQLKEVATSNIVWNGVTTASDGRIFVNLPIIGDGRR